MAMERRKLLEIVADYLRSVEVEAQPGEEDALDVFRNIVKEPVIRITGRNIGSIRVTSSDYFGCSMPDNISRFRYEVPLGKKLESEMIREIGARIEYERDRKKMGLFGGEVTGVRWTGGKLAGLLDGDKEISRVLLYCAKSPGNPDFEVKMKYPDTAEILGPRFADLWRIKELFERGLKEGFEECVFGFSTCDRIAGHIKEFAG